MRLVVDDSTGAVHIDRIVDRNTTIPFLVNGFAINVIVTLIHQQDGSMLFAVRGLVFSVPPFTERYSRYC